MSDALVESLSPWRRTAHRFRKNRVAMFGLVIVAGVAVVAVFGPWLSPQSPAVLVRDFKTDKTFIITRSDVIRVL